jgi:hypothetical protein
VSRGEGNRNQAWQWWNRNPQEKYKKPLDKTPNLWYNTGTRGEETKVAREFVSLNGGVLETKVGFYRT